MVRASQWEALNGPDDVKYTPNHLWDQFWYQMNSSFADKAVWVRGSLT